MNESLLGYVWRRSKRDQAIILALALSVFPLTYAALELPKLIINGALQGEAGPRAVGPLEFTRLQYLVLLCLALFGTVLVSNVLKWWMQVWTGRSGAKLLASLRADFFERTLRFPLARLKRERPGDLVQRMMGEVEQLGGFMGGLIVEPVFQTGLLLVYAGFVFAQSVWLGLGAVAMFPLQAWLMPKLQAKIVRLNRERALGNRAYAEFVSETVESVDDTRLNGATAWRAREVARKLSGVVRNRVDIAKRKYLVKGVNNVINQLSPALFYGFGGWLVLAGRLELGSLVAVIAAQREMANPWKALLTFAQQAYDFASRYAFATQAFSDPDLEPRERVFGAPEREPPRGELVVEIAEAGAGGAGLRASRFTLPAGASAAILGGEDGAAAALAGFIAGLAAPRAGGVSLGGRRLDRESLRGLGAAVGYVGPDPSLIRGTLDENLLYGLLSTAPEAALERADLRDAARAAAGEDAGEARLLALCEAVGLSPDLRRLGLDRRLPPEEAAEWAGRLPALAKAMEAAAGGGGLSDFVERWDRRAINREATLIENLLFCWPAPGRVDPEALALDAEVAAALRETGAEAFLAGVGEAVAEEFRELAEASGRGAALDGFEGWGRGRILAAVEALAPVSRFAVGAKAARRRALAAVGARFTPARDRLDVLDAAQEARLLALRETLLARLSATGATPFDAAGVDPNRSLFDNLLRGRRRRDRAAAAGALDEAADRAAVEAGLGRELARLGLGAEEPGEALSPVARRRVALARALVKRPALIVLDRAFARAEDAALRGRVKAEAPEAILVWTAADEGGAAGADHLIRIETNGRARLERPGAAGGDAERAVEGVA